MSKSLMAVGGQNQAQKPKPPKPKFRRKLKTTFVNPMLHNLSAQEEGRKLMESGIRVRLPGSLKEGVKKTKDKPLDSNPHAIKG